MEGLIIFIGILFGIIIFIYGIDVYHSPEQRLYSKIISSVLFFIAFLDGLGLYTAQKVKYIERPVFEVKYPEGYKKQFVVNPSLKLEELEGYDDEIKVRKYDIYRNSIFQYSFYRLEKNDS